MTRLNQHDAPAEPVKLHEQHAVILDEMRASQQVILPYMDKLHDEIAKLHGKVDALIAAFEAPAKG